MKANRSIAVKTTLALATLIGIYGWMISGALFAQVSAPFQRFQDPTAPYTWHAVAGAQYGLSVTSAAAVALTVPATATCAIVIVNTANVRRRSDGTSPTTTVGLLQVFNNSAAYDCGPIASYKYIAVSTTATLDVEYFY